MPQQKSKASKEKQNLKNATQMEKMRPVIKGPNVPRAKTTLGDGKGNIAKSGKTIKKAKSGGKFDLNKDGKTTFKDVLIGRGVLPKKAKAGTKMKTCKGGC
jgi:hypothetical protein